jgi:hypothetical protein
LRQSIFEALQKPAGKIGIFIVKNFVFFSKKGPSISIHEIETT